MIDLMYNKSPLIIYNYDSISNRNDLFNGSFNNLSGSLEEHFGLPDLHYGSFPRRNALVTTLL
jgi:hypothetical protein